MQQPSRDLPLNYWIATSYLAVAFVLSFGSVVLMQRRNDSGNSEPESMSSTLTKAIPQTWSQLSLLFDSWAGTTQSGNCTREELQAFKQQMHRMIAEKQKACLNLRHWHTIQGDKWRLLSRT